MGQATQAAATDRKLVERVFERITGDLGMIIDREFAVEQVTAERLNKRPAGKSKVHISFKLGFKSASGLKRGCLLIPLPDAISLAAYLMMVPDDAVKSHRSMTTLDRSTKDAMLEVGNFVAGATDAVLRNWLSDQHSVRSEGCQGVRPNVRPAFPYEEGSPLVVGRARARIHKFSEFEMILMVPVLDQG